MGFDPDLFHKALMGEELPPPPPEPVREPLPESLQDKLQLATGLALDQAIELLRAPLENADGAMLRAKTATQNHVLTTQVRVEETKFKAQQSEDTLNKLLEIIAREKKLLGRI